MHEKLLTVKEVADILRCSEQWVRNQIKAGRLHAIKVSPRGWRIPRKSLDNFMKERDSEH